jgi:hypothetical protein
MLHPDDSVPEDAPESSPAPEEEQLAPYLIEAARSSRSKCRTCKRKIDKDLLRIGILLEGPYGTGYLWHHLTCAARRRFEDVEAAYEEQAWAEGVTVPPLDELRKLKEVAEKKAAERKSPPWAERAKSGRSKCKHCDELIAQGDWRVILSREVEFFGQVRTGPVNIHTGCVAAELMTEHCATEPEELEAGLRANSVDLDEAALSEVLAAIGDVG